MVLQVCSNTWWCLSNGQSPHGTAATYASIAEGLFFAICQTLNPNRFDGPAVKFGAFWRVPYHRDADDMARNGSLLGTPQGRFDRAERPVPGIRRVLRADGLE